MGLGIPTCLGRAKSSTMTVSRINTGSIGIKLLYVMSILDRKMLGVCMLIKSRVVTRPMGRSHDVLPHFQTPVSRLTQYVQHAV